MPTVHLIIKGKVQGVFFRASARDKARALGITGWIKNTEEGFVESVATGSLIQLEEFIDWCKKGPSQANVTEVIISQRAEEPFNQFSIQNS